MIQARSAGEQKKIDQLLQIVETQDAVFIRNGTEYNSREAAAHMRMKLSRAGNRVETARDFIRHIASSSYLSGRPYYIRFRDGRLVKSGDWLLERLRELEAPAPPARNRRDAQKPGISRVIYDAGHQAGAAGPSL